MKRNERTSNRVARIAGKILAIKAVETHATLWGVEKTEFGDENGLVWIKWSDIRAIAASCLTQTRNKPKRRKVRK